MPGTPHASGPANDTSPHPTASLPSSLAAWMGRSRTPSSDATSASTTGCGRVSMSVRSSCLRGSPSAPIVATTALPTPGARQMGWAAGRMAIVRIGVMRRVSNPDLSIPLRGHPARAWSTRPNPGANSGRFRAMPGGTRRRALPAASGLAPRIERVRRPPEVVRAARTSGAKSRSGVGQWPGPPMPGPIGIVPLAWSVARWMTWACWASACACVSVPALTAAASSLWPSATSASMTFWTSTL